MKTFGDTAFETGIKHIPRKQGNQRRLSGVTGVLTILSAERNKASGPAYWLGTRSIQVVYIVEV